MYLRIKVLSGSDVTRADCMLHNVIDAGNCRQMEAASVIGKSHDDLPSWIRVSIFCSPLSKYFAFCDGG